MFKKLKIIKQYLKTKDFYDKKELEIHQKKSLLKLFKNLNSNFYPNSLELKNYPIINKKIFMDNFNDINSLQITQEEAFEIALDAEKSRDFSSKLKNITVGLSSGTTGNRGIFLVSEDESALWAGYILKRMLPKPLLQKHKIAFFLRSNSNLYESVNSSLISFSFSAHQQKDQVDWLGKGASGKYWQDSEYPKLYQPLGGAPLPMPQQEQRQKSPQPANQA